MRLAIDILIFVAGFIAGGLVVAFIAGASRTTEDRHEHIDGRIP